MQASVGVHIIFDTIIIIIDSKNSTKKRFPFYITYSIILPGKYNARDLHYTYVFITKQMRGEKESRIKVLF